MRNIDFEDICRIIERHYGIEENNTYDIVIPFIGFHHRMKMQANHFRIFVDKDSDFTETIFDKVAEDGRHYKEFFKNNNVYRVFKEFYNFEKMKKGLVKITNYVAPYNYDIVPFVTDEGRRNGVLMYFMKREDIY